MIKFFQVCAITALLILSSGAQAAVVTATVDRSKVMVGETVTLILQTNDTDQSLETDLRALGDDFDVLDQRSETQMSFVNGQKAAHVRLVITLEPKHAGDIIIPALKFSGASSLPVTLQVSEPPAIKPGEPEPVFIEVTVLPDSGPYYVLSQLGLMVRIFYQTNLTEAAINPPAPAQASVRLLDEVPYQAQRNGINYRVLERRYAIFPERSGALIIPPMQLSGRLIERPTDRLWQPTVRGRRVRVESEAVNLEIRPRPDEFNGAGWLPARRITLSQKISDNEPLHVGEPITRTVILDAVGLEEHMLEEPVWPDTPGIRIYPDQPQGISRDDGEWVLGHKEFRYAIVPEAEGDLVLPELRLDWWDTVTHRQRTAVLPEHQVVVLPLDLDPITPASEPLSGGVMPESVIGATAEAANSNHASFLWRIATAVFALLWLLTLYLYYQKGAAATSQGKHNGLVSLDEKTLLKHFQVACQKNETSSARKFLARWIRDYSPQTLRGNMRDFGAACGDQSLKQAIEELDAAGFTGDDATVWQGSGLWATFKQWQAATPGFQKPEIGHTPKLY